MVIHVDFDLILIAIFITIFITGYIRGGGIELLRVLKVVIPFFVLYFYGNDITNLLFSSQKTVDFVYKFLPNIPYRNTIAALSSQIGVYIVVYLLLAIFLWRLGKYVLDERIEYIFGRYNSILGGLFSLVRMYVIISIFIIPFYALNFTNYSDPITSFILNNPPNFSRLGVLIEKTKPTVDKFNEVTASLKIMDIQSLEKYSTLLVDVKDFMTTNETNAYQIYQYLEANHLIEGTYTPNEFLYYYVNHIDEFKNMKFTDTNVKNVNDSLSKLVNEYSQVFIWAYDNDVQDMESTDDIIASFINNYPSLVANTSDKLSLDILEKMKLKTQVYLVLKNWLVDSYGIQVNSDFDLLNDENLELILNDFASHKQALVEAINNIDAKDSEKEDIIQQVERFSMFQAEYITTYKQQIDLYNQILDNVSFKYKLAFAIMKEKKFNQVIDDNVNKDSLLYIFSLDSLGFINYFSQDDNQIYYEAGQVYVALFLLNIEPNQQIQKISYDGIIENLNQYTGNEDLFKRTKIDINKIIQSLLVDRNHESYLEFLIKNNLCEEGLLDKLVQSDEIKEILTYSNYLLLENLDQKMNNELS